MLESPLGQKTVYVETYSPEQLFPISRRLARDKTGIGLALPFTGVDVWNGYEISWLNLKGKPVIALAEFVFSCASPHVVESKSFKLYLNSFNQSHFDSFEQVQKLMENDLSKASGAHVRVNLFPVNKLSDKKLSPFIGNCLDDLDIETDIYHVQNNFLTTESDNISEVLYTDLFKSNCLATGQPDWGSVWIKYEGKRLNHEGLLKYLISYRRHSGFGEHCVEQIYFDIMNQCQPEKLSVYGRFTRRGGLDINPFRSNFEAYPPSNLRQIRQ